MIKIYIYLTSISLCCFLATRSYATTIDPTKDTKLCMRPPINHAPESEFVKVFGRFFGSCEDNLSPEQRKRICIPIAPSSEIARLNSELQKTWNNCPEPKPTFLPPATSNCSCACKVYHGQGINYCTDEELSSWKINSM